MEESEALRIAREAVQTAKQKVGDNQKALEKELENRERQDPNLFEAFRIAGHLIVSAGQEQKH